MQTKLSIFCEKLIEAGWLASLILVPVFFNIYSARSFEPDKLTLMRSIALVMALAWLIKLAETGIGTALSDSDSGMAGEASASVTLSAPSSQSAPAWHSGDRISACKGRTPLCHTS
jgi:hypothetical protein